MNRAFTLAALGLVLVVGSASAAERQATVPAAFQGTWSGDRKQCGEAGDESRLVIGPDEIRFYESTGAIKAVVTEGERGLALITEMSGEGETWLAFDQFELSADKTTLTDMTDDAGFVRYRCPR
jgi:hypothetical protein